MIASHIKPLLLFSLLISFISSKSNVHMIIETFRHGTRNPLHPLPLFDVDLTREDYEDLTITGMRNHFFLGYLIRKKYTHLISENLATHNVSINVSGTKRTVSSVKSQLAGMHYTFQSQMYLNTEDQPQYWMPPNSSISPKKFESITAIPQGLVIMPLDIQGNETNFLFFGASVCPNISQEFINSYTKEMENLEGKLNETYYVMEKNGFKHKDLFEDSVWSVYNLFNLSDTYLSSVFSNYQFNESFENFNWEAFLHMDIVHTIRENVHGNDAKVNKVANTLLFRKWIEQIEAYERYLEDSTKNDKPTTVNLFSAHDLTLTMIIKSLINENNAECMINVYEKYVKNAVVNNENDYKEIMKQINLENCVDTVAFASQLILEIYSEDENPDNRVTDTPKLYVRILMNNKLFPINGKDNMTTGEFKKLLREKSVKNYNKECGSPLIYKKDKLKTLKIFIYILFVFCGISLFLAVIVNFLVPKDHVIENDENEQLMNN